MAFRLQNFVNLNKSDYLYFMQLNSFFWEQIRRFDHNLKEVHGTKKVKYPLCKASFATFSTRVWYGMRDVHKNLPILMDSKSNALLRGIN
jgi:hypothetical protein